MGQTHLENKHWWTTLSDKKLLALPFSQLNLSIIGTPLEKRIARLFQELDSRGIRFRPHFWLSTHWFAPEDSPGIAIPFYLAHPRLKKLERKMMLEVEGGTESWCMKLLRHETGHAIDTAYQLYRKKKYRDAFGKATLPYPEEYTPKPFSKSYVQHLDLWYAQAHPVEDFAETFAVWLTYPKSWRKRYKGWKALKKLECVDEMMAEVANKPAKVKTKKKIDPLEKISLTLGEHYAQKLEKYGLSDKTFYDRELLRLFPETDKEKGIAASTFLRKNRVMLQNAVSLWTGEYLYTVAQLVEQMIDRSRELKLRATGPEEELLRNCLAMITVQATSNMLSIGRGIQI